MEIGVVVAFGILLAWGIISPMIFYGKGEDAGELNYKKQLAYRGYGRWVLGEYSSPTFILGREEENDVKSDGNTE